MRNQTNLAEELEEACQSLKEQGVKTTIKRGPLVEQRGKDQGKPTSIECKFENGNEIEARRHAISWTTDGYSSESHITPSESDKVFIDEDYPHNSVQVLVSGEKGIDSKHRIRGEK
jgi:hypothetical protein